MRCPANSRLRAPRPKTGISSTSSWVDVAEARVSDVVSRPIDGVEVDEIVRVASSIAEEVDLFIRPTRALPEGDGGIFVSSEPRGATIFVNGIGIGRTPDVAPVSLAEGRYRLEVRADGYLPSIRYVEVASGDTRFVHVVLTPEQGGSVQVESSPLADVVVEGRPQGRTPLTIPVTPGRHVLTIARDGFEARQVEVPVRVFRVTRMNVALEPVATPLVYWDPPRVTVVRINGELQRAQAATNLGTGAVRIELIESGRRRTIDAVLTEDGVYFLDLDAGTLEQTSP